MIARLVALAVMATALVLGAPPARALPPTWGFQVVHVYPHDRGAFTEGLFYLDGYLYESTGLEGHSDIRKVELATGRVVQSRPVASQYFGEGIVSWKNELIELTWRSHIGFIYDLATLRPIGRFAYPGEGWALTRNSRWIIMSDGTSHIRFLDPETLKEVRRITVRSGDEPIENINELEWVKGEILANVWMTNRIARIDPQTGYVKGWIDLTGLLPPADASSDSDDVLNGIAYDAANDRLFVTGKRWPKLFEIRLVRRPG